MDEPSVTRASLPKGYSFVPKGNVFITGNCRRQTHTASRTVYVVFSKGDKKKQIGIGVPTDIYLQVQLDELNTRAERASSVLRRDKTIAKEFEKAIMEEFPRIPINAVPRVLEKALEKGKGKVGRTSTLDISRKAVLAVQAHIRHRHTNYDTLLRGGMSRAGARRDVAAKVHDVYGAWSRPGNRPLKQEGSKRQLPEPEHTTSTSGQAEPPKPRTTDRQLTDPPARNPKTNEPSTTDRNKSNNAPVDLVMQQVGDMRRTTFLNFTSHTKGNKRMLKKSKEKPQTEKASRKCNGDAPKRITRRMKTVRLASKTVTELSDAGLQRAEVPEAMGNIARELSLLTAKPTPESQVITPETTSTEQMKTKHAPSQGQLARQSERELEFGNPRNTENQRKPQENMKIVIDLTGDSDEDVVSVNHNSDAAEAQQ